MKHTIKSLQPIVKAYPGYYNGMYTYESGQLCMYAY
jgi:hypothetical protein